MNLGENLLGGSGTLQTSDGIIRNEEMAMIASTIRVVSALTVICVGLFVPTAASAQDAASRVTTIETPERGRPVLAKRDDEGVIHLLYEAPQGPWYVKTADEGKSFSTPLPVVDAKVRKPGLEFKAEDMAIGKAGRIHVVMSTNAWKVKLPQNEWGAYYATIDPTSKAFSPVRNINVRPSEGYSLAADDKGNVTLSWLADKLYANVSRDNGKTFTPTVEINPVYNPCDCCTTNSTYAADGKLAILYREETNNDRDMYLVLWDQARRKANIKRISTEPWNVNACPMTYYSITRTASGFNAVWPTKGNVYFARLDSQGNVLPPGEIKTPGANGMRTSMVGLSAYDGSTLVAWKKDDQLGWQLYDSAGKPTGQSGSTRSPGSGVAAVAGKDGRFILFR